MLKRSNFSQHAGPRLTGGLAHPAVILTLVGAAAVLTGCNRTIDIVSRTVTSGTINGAAIRGSINATIHVGRGGTSSCTFDQLPPKFTPATIGTHT